jgi:NADH dehydrogenase (ubiquinone) Fe-S protein 3
MTLKLANNLKNVLPLLSLSKQRNEIVIVVSPSLLIFTLNCLKLHSNFQFSSLSCISGVDYFHSKYRFGVVYELLSMNMNSRIRVKIFVNEITSICSSILIYKSANWWEREIWDLFGIYFRKHPDLRRILTDYGFEGYPLRKDFPLSGYVEVRYNQKKKRVILQPIELAQEFRSFTFERSWLN